MLNSSSYRNGFGRRPRGVKQGPIVVRLADIADGRLNLSQPRRVAMSARELDTYQLQPNDLLFVRLNGRGDQISRCVLVDQLRPDLVALGKRVNGVTRSIGMALTSCTPHAKGSPLFELGEDEMEMGIGIHGEPGRRRVKLASANAIIDELLEAVASDLPFQSGDRVALMINGLGGTPISELYILYGRAHEQLASRGIAVGRNYVGEYCTSLDMAGCSLTLVKLDSELESLLAAPAEVAVRIF
jgi:Dak1 domain-containing protein